MTEPKIKIHRNPKAKKKQFWVTYGAKNFKTLQPTQMFTRKRNAEGNIIASARVWSGLLGVRMPETIKVIDCTRMHKDYDFAYYLRTDMIP